jgi:hypothetical protein
MGSDAMARAKLSAWESRVASSGNKAMTQKRPLQSAVPLTLLTIVSLAASSFAQSAKPPALPSPDPNGPGCMVVQFASRGEQLFSSDVIFEYLYSSDVNAVKEIDRYQAELAKWKAKPEPKGDAPTPPFFNIATLTV